MFFCSVFPFVHCRGRMPLSFFFLLLLLGFTVRVVRAGVCGLDGGPQVAAHVSRRVLRVLR